MKTYSPKPTDIDRKWYIIDAKSATLGRISTEIATLLTGKSKPTYAPHLDSGDFVIVINAKETVVTGNKEEGKIYYRHTGFPGGIRQRTLAEQRDIDATEIIRHAVKGMLPKNKLVDARLARLKIYEGSEHPHAPQQPEEWKASK